MSIRLFELLVTRTNTHALLHLIDQISSLNMECQNLPLMNNDSRIMVKKIGGVIDCLEEIQDDIESLTTKIDKKEKIMISVKHWIKNLEKNYREQEEYSELPYYLTVSDAKGLEKYTDSWSNYIIESFSDKETAILKEEAIEKILGNDVTKDLDEIAKQDLEDGINVLLHLYPTPATMILFRVAERIIQEFYKNIMGTDSKNKTWGQMLVELEKTGKVKKSLMGYLHHLNEKRIDSAHPYRRFTQEEAERILLQLKDLIESIKR